MATLDLTAQTFARTIAEHAIVVVDFWASWCGPCRAFAPVFAAASEKFPEVVFAKVNTETEQSVAAGFSIRSIPTVMLFRDQIILYAEAGSLPAAALDDLVTQALALDMDAVRREIATQAG